MLNICIERQRNGRKLLILLLQVVKKELIKESSGMSRKWIGVERSTLLFLLDEQVSSLNHNDDDLRRKRVQDWIMKVHYASRFFC